MNREANRQTVYGERQALEIAVACILLCAVFAAGCSRLPAALPRRIPAAQMPQITTQRLVYPLSVTTYAVSDRCMAGDEDVLPIAMEDVVSGTLAAMRHHYGALELVYCPDGIHVMMPPDLDRNQQVELYQALDLRVRDSLLLYVDLWWAWNRGQTQAAIVELEQSKLAAIVQTTASQQTTSVERLEAEKAVSQAEIQLSMTVHEGVGDVGLSQARRKLLADLGAADECWHLVPADEPLVAQVACWSCDIAHALGNNSQLLVDKMQLVRPLYEGRTRQPWLQAIVSKAPPSMQLTDELFEMAKARESELAEHLADARAKLHDLALTKRLLDDRRGLVAEQMSKALAALDAGATTSIRVYEVGLLVLQLDQQEQQVVAQQAKATIEYQWLAGRLLQSSGVHVADFWFGNDLLDSEAIACPCGQELANAYHAHE